MGATVGAAAEPLEVWLGVGLVGLDGATHNPSFGTDPNIGCVPKFKFLGTFSDSLLFCRCEVVLK